MNAQLAPILVGLVASCLLLRTRTRGVKPRPLLSGLSVAELDASGARSDRGPENGLAFDRSGQNQNRKHALGVRSPRTRTARLLSRTVQVRTPTGLRRWVRTPTISLKLVPMLLGGIVFVLAPTIAPALALCIIGVIRIRKRRSTEQLRARRCLALPDLVDMIRLCVASGCTPHGSLVVLGSLPLRADDVLGPLVANAAEGLKNGAVVAEVLDEFQTTIGEAARPLCSALRSSADAGTPIGETLDLLAREARRTRKAQADVAAKRLPVLLLFPLITCILPAFALLAIVPLLGGALSALHW
jgi:Flp pilus assembly protein TadB